MALNCLSVTVTSSTRWLTLGKKVTLLHQPSGRCYELNGSAAFVWELIAARVAVRDVAEHLAHRYQIKLDLATRDVEHLLSTLEARDLVAFGLSDA